MGRGGSIADVAFSSRGPKPTIKHCATSFVLVFGLGFRVLYGEVAVEGLCRQTFDNCVGSYMWIVLRFQSPPPELIGAPEDLHIRRVNLVCRQTSHRDSLRGTYGSFPK